jgi:DNA-binding GntR family transcriptional regulator
LPRGRIQSALEELALLNVFTKSEGQSWVFRQEIVNGRSNRQSLDFRIALETAALEASGFKADSEALKVVLQGSEDILARPPNGIDPAAFAAAEREFHSFIAHASGNPFIEGAIMAHLTLLDLLAPRLGFNDHAARAAIGEHLQILLDIESGRLEIARDRLRLHLATAHGPQDWTQARPILPTEGTR